MSLPPVRIRPSRARRGTCRSWYGRGTQRPVNVARPAAPALRALFRYGQLFARIPRPKGQVAGFGALSASPGRRVVAYILTMDSGDSSTVFVFRPGGPPVAVYRTAHGSSPCALHPLAWHGSWRLYPPHGGRAVIIDTAGRHRIIRLRPPSPAATAIRSGFTPFPGGNQPRRPAACTGTTAAHARPSAICPPKRCPERGVLRWPT